MAMPEKFHHFPCPQLLLVPKVIRGHEAKEEAGSDRHDKLKDQNQIRVDLLHLGRHRLVPPLLRTAVENGKRETHETKRSGQQTADRNNYG